MNCFHSALGPVYYGVGIAGGITTFILGILFLLNVFRHIKKSPAAWRRLLAWITSTPMVVSNLSLIIFLVPRAGDTYDTVKQVYLPLVLMHFINLALMIQGGEQGIIRDLVGTDSAPLSLCAPPCCCFGLCFRNLTFTKYRPIKETIVKSLVKLNITLMYIQNEIKDNSRDDLSSSFDPIGPHYDHERFKTRQSH